MRQNSASQTQMSTVPAKTWHLINSWKESRAACSGLNMITFRLKRKDWSLYHPHSSGIQKRKWLVAVKLVSRTRHVSLYVVEHELTGYDTAATLWCNV